jgi:hypothetical protein
MTYSLLAVVNDAEALTPKLCASVNHAWPRRIGRAQSFIMPKIPLRVPFAIEL